MSDPGDYADAPEIAEEIMAGFRRTARGVSARFTAGQHGYGLWATVSHDR